MTADSAVQKKGKPLKIVKKSSFKRKVQRILSMLPRFKRQTITRKIMTVDGTPIKLH